MKLDHSIIDLKTISFQALALHP